MFKEDKYSFFEGKKEKRKIIAVFPKRRILSHSMTFGESFPISVYYHFYYTFIHIEVILDRFRAATELHRDEADIECAYPRSNGLYPAEEYT